MTDSPRPGEISCELAAEVEAAYEHRIEPIRRIEELKARLREYEKYEGRLSPAPFSTPRQGGRP